MVWWDAGEMVNEGEEEIVESRAMRVQMREMRSQREIAIYGAYMPVRGQKENEEEVEDVWQRMRERVEREELHWCAVGGDLNAETRERREEVGSKRTTKSDAHLDSMMEESALTALAAGQTHHSGTQIDNWLVSRGAVQEMGDTMAMPGVCGKDHNIIATEWVGRHEETGTQRPKGRGHQFKPESKDKMEMEKIKLYTEEMESMYEEMGGSLEESEDDEPEEGQPCDWIAELKKFQDACTRAAEKTAEAEKGKKKGRGRSTQTKAEAKRASVGKWNRIATQATKWNGKLTPGKKEWSNTTFAKVPQIEQDPKVRAAVAARGAVKAAVLEVCDRELKRATLAFENCDAYRGERLVTEMEETVGESAGGVMIKVFEILRRACTKGGAQQGGMVAVRSTTRASHREWVRTDKTPKGREIRNTKLRTTLARGGRVTDAEWADMGVTDLGMEDYAMEGGNVWKPKHGRIECARDEVMKEVQKQASEINATRETDVRTLRRMLRWLRPARHQDTVDVAKELCTWEACDAAIRRGFKRGKGVGIDGFDGYLVRILPEKARRRYWRILKGMVERNTYPQEWNEWIAMLAMKPGEDPTDLGRRRDLWLQCHSMKCLFRMILPAYEEAAETCGGVWQAGWTAGRCAPEQTLVARIVGEQKMRARKMCCRGYCDLGSYFMSVVHAVQWEVEEWSGVPVSVMEVVRVLREGHTEEEGENAMRGLVGRYETAYGLTDPVQILKGLGQGDLASPARAKQLLTVIAGAVDKACAGAHVTGTEGRVGTLFFADDAMLLSDDVQTLQRAFEAVWVVTKVAGLKVQVKQKKKTAWSATYWEEDGTERDVEGWDMRVGGMTIPQLVGEERYRYLGSEMTTGWSGGESQCAIREEVVRKCRQALGMIGRIPLITEEQMGRASALALSGIIGYYGRAAVITWEDAVRIEEARTQMLRARNVTTALPRATVYAGRESGLGHTHAYAYAAAALCDQVERALDGGEGEAARAVVEAELANTCARLGCRDEHPIEWDASHLVEGTDALREDMVMEAYLRRRVQCGVRSKLTWGGRRLEGPLREEKWRMSNEQRRQAGPKLWEPTVHGPWQTEGKCTFSRTLAAAGIATWADITGPDGTVIQWRECKRRWGVKEGGKAKAELERVRREVGEAEAGLRERWEQQARAERETSQRATERAAEEEIEWGEGEWEVSEVLAARRAPECMGGWEYRVRWAGGYADTWEAARQMGGTAAMKRDMERARTEREVSVTFEAWLDKVKEEGRRARAQKARRAIERMRDERDEAEDGEWADVWDLFVEYANEARRWDDGGSNVGSNPRERRGAGWECDRTRTSYEGEETMREKVQKDGTVAMEKGRKASLEGGGSVREGDAKRAEEEQLRREREARERGEEIFQPLLPETHPVGAMDLEGTDVFQRHLGTVHECQSLWRVAQDAVARLWARDMWLEGQETIRTRSGRGVRLDDGNVKALRGNVALRESSNAMKVTMDLHTTHMFTHAFATDGSKAEGRRGNTAYGLWSGADMERWGAERETGAEMLVADENVERAAVGAGLEGGRLPSTWEVVDAEMYAVFRALLRVYREAVSEGGERAARECRVLVLTDCQSAMRQIEKGWRQKETRHEGKGDRRAMLEAICRIRARLGTCVLCYVPAHEGCSPNEYADACAKSHLGAEEMEDTTSRLAKWVETMPRVMERQTSKGEWETMDRAAYRGMRECATEYARRRVERGVGEGRIRAGAEGRIWEAWGERALSMTKPEVGTGGVVEKPTWEDAHNHMEGIGVVMGLRNTDGVGVPHEKEWERKCGTEGAAGGPATREGEDGCAACRRAAIERVKAATARGQQMRMPDVVPKATWQHWLVGPCAGASGTWRTAMRCSAQRIAGMLTRAAKGEAGETRAVCDMGMRAAEKAERREVVTNAEYAALAQVIAAQVPHVGESMEKKMGNMLPTLDGERRRMVRAAYEQRKHVEEVGKGVGGRRREQEEHRGWLKLTLRAWAAEVKRTGKGNLVLRALARAEVEARRRSVRSGRREIRVVEEGRGEERRLVRVDVERWWARLQQRTHAMATWARVVRRNDRGWYVRGEGRGRQGGEATERGGERDTGRETAVRAGNATRGEREGVRLWWWLEEGDGGDARGPGSVRRGVRTEADPEEARTRDGIVARGAGVEHATEPCVVGVVEEEGGDGLDELGLDHVLDDDEGRAAMEVGEGGLNDEEGVSGAGGGAVAVEAGVGLARRGANPDVHGRSGDGGGGGGVGEGGGGREAARGPGREQRATRRSTRLGSEHILPVQTEEIEGGRGSVDATESRGVAQRTAADEGGDVEGAEELSDDTGVHGAAEGGDGLRRREEGRGEHGGEGTGVGDGEGEGNLADREVLAGGGENVMVGWVGGGDGQRDGVEEAGGEGGGGTVPWGAPISRHTAGSTLRADDGGRVRGRQAPGVEEAREARGGRRRRTTASIGGIQPGVEGRRTRGGNGRQLQRTEEGEIAAAAQPALATAASGSRAQAHVGSAASAVVLQNSNGTGGGGAAGNMGEMRAETGEDGGVREQLQQFGLTTHATRARREGGDSSEESGGSGEAERRGVPNGTGASGIGGGRLEAAGAIEEATIGPRSGSSRHETRAQLRTRNMCT